MGLKIFWDQNRDGWMLMADDRVLGFIAAEGADNLASWDLSLGSLVDRTIKPPTVSVIDEENFNE